MGKLLQKYAFPASGAEFYVPRNLSAYVKDTGSMVKNVRFASHGYVGHGSFCEFSKIGKGSSINSVLW
jgi:hypothetical protein